MKPNLTPLLPAVLAQDARHQEWCAFAYRWAEVLHLWHQVALL